ncbi:Low-affinity methionine permease-like protein [Elsinoe fawcettii]|nr:Low-affinity methionine permease-like protein [Elsinoe fawcettii]
MSTTTETSPLLPHPIATTTLLDPEAPKDTSPPTRDVASSTLPETATTGRTLGSISSFMLILSRVIGSGIFAMPGTVLQSVGSPALSLLLWAAGALIAWCGLSVDLEYGCMLPRSGGMKVYLEYTYPRPRWFAATVTAVHVVLLGFTASNCVVFAKYVLFAVGREAGDWDVKILAVGLMTGITVVHGCFYRTGVWVQNVLGWVKIGLVLFMILTGLFVVVFRGLAKELVPAAVGMGGGMRIMDDLWTGADWSYNTLATALFKISYSYAGLNNINTVLNEVKNPVRTLKTVPPFALITACLLYILINLAYLAVVPLEEVKQSRELIAALFFQKVFGDGFGSKFLPIAIALSAAGNVMVVTFSLARINQEVARAGLIPFSSYLSSSRPFYSPLGGLIVHYIPSVLVIVLPPSKIVYAFIAEVEGYSSQFFALAIGIGLLILRQRKPDLARPFKAWTPIVWLRLAICTILILAPLFPPKRKDVDGGGMFYALYALVALAVLLFSVAYWYIWTRLLPRLGRYKLEEEVSVLKDGTTITRLVRR